MEKRKATIGILLLSIGCYYLFRTISIMKQNENIIIAFNSTTLILIIIPLLLLVFVFRYYKHKNKNENKTDIAGEEDKYINRAKRMVSRWSGKQQEINRKNPINEMILNRNSITQDYSSFVNET